MGKFLSWGILLLFLASGTAWAKQKKSPEAGKGSKSHSHKKGSKASKGQKNSKGGGDGEANMGSEITKKDLTFNGNQ
jgi:hypothetical protein